MSRSESEPGSPAVDGTHERKQEAEDGWRYYTEAQCEAILISDPFDMHARFRSAQIWIGREENMEDAEKLLVSIQK